MSAGRAAVALEARHDLTSRDDVDAFVRAFYRAVAQDDLLAPVFEAAGVDWAAHVPKLVDFWAWQLLGEPGYAGHPLRAHEHVHAAMPFTDAMYERWLDLFDATLDAAWTGPVADAARQRARKMAHALHRLLGGAHP